MDKDKEIDRLESALHDHERKARTTSEFLEKRDQMEAELVSLRAQLETKIKESDQALT